jgi:ubiquinone biosynthesis protein
MDEAPAWAMMLPELPRLAHKVLGSAAAQDVRQDAVDLEQRSRRQLRWTRLLCLLVALLVALEVWRVAG